MVSAAELIMDLDLRGLAPARGRRAAAIEYQVLRELNQADFALLRNPPQLGATTPWLARITNRHHALARLLAEGRPGAEISAILGYSQSRISILQDDPSLKELVEFYRSQLQVVYLNVHERLAALGISCMEELQARLEESPGDFTPRELREIMDTAFNKSVAPDKVTKNGVGTGLPGGVQLNISFVQSPNANAPVLAHPKQLELAAEEDDL